MVACDQYVRMMQPFIASDQRPPIVYTDESYIHHHYKCPNYDLYDPLDKLDVPRKEKHKGRRYCFIAAILDSPTMDSHVMALDIFTGGNSKAKEPKDYHAMFNHEYYVTWFGKLLKELEDLGVCNALIVMDNAKYHKGRPSNTPKSRQSKSCLLEACSRYGIEVTGDEYKSMLWTKLSAYIEANVPPVIVSMAQDHGHKIVFTPPYHSDLQPIELIWATVKSAVGRQYTDMTKFPEVKVRLIEAFDNLSHHTIKGCVRSAEGKLQKLHEHLLHIDALEVYEESSGESSGTCDDIPSDTE
ncbi:hypothetical protein Ae201684_015500 [Aphanomyces euteiches]|nr:hypothetical protein Ae201684_015500 [Aphanomyces euteiches]